MSQIVELVCKDEDKKEEATKKFQALGAVYKILGDKDAKAVYDETGEIPDDEGSAFDPDKDWTDYWRILFKKVTLEDVKKFEEKFRESQEEEEELEARVLWLLNLQGAFHIVSNEAVLA